MQQSNVVEEHDYDVVMEDEEMIPSSFVELFTVHEPDVIVEEGQVVRIDIIEQERRSPSDAEEEIIGTLSFFLALVISSDLCCA